MRRHHSIPQRKGEQGIVITLVAVVMASVVIVMAALAIDLTTLYTARSEAQLAADGAALAGARVLASSGMTSSEGYVPAFDTATAESLATTVAVQVASSNLVGGKALSGTGTCGAAGISVCFNVADVSNPRVTVQVGRTDLPTFFLRFWRTTLAVSASATAEAYNPSGLSSRRHRADPIAPVCVKPWLLPNLDPTQTTNNAIFDRRDGTIENFQLIGQGWPNTNPPSPNGKGLVSHAVPYVGGTASAPANGQYYAGLIDAADFPVPTKALPACSSGFSTYDYMLAVAGCVPQPIPCGFGATINIDTGAYVPLNANRDADTAEAVECLTHYNGAVGDTDSIAGETTPPLPPPSSITPPFEFVGGNQNPVAGAQGQNVVISDSIVTIPVYDTGVNTGFPAPVPTNPVTVIGFLQVFLNPQSNTLPDPTGTGPYQIPVTIINQIGCGTRSGGTFVYGNGPSAVPVRLITPP